MIRRNKKKLEYTFQMQAYSVETIPMNKLAEYITDLSLLLGEQCNVHLGGIESGSVVLKMNVDEEAGAKVKERFRLLKRNQAPIEAQKALVKINRRLENDQATASLVDKSKKNIIQFPDAGEAKIGPVQQFGTLDGVPVKVGGYAKNVPIHLSRPDKGSHICTAPRAIAKEIAAHLFAEPIRVEGIGTWYRWADGDWEMTAFNVNSFIVLEDIDLCATIDKLRSIDFQFDPDEDLVDAMEKIRYGA